MPIYILLMKIRGIASTFKLKDSPILLNLLTKYYLPTATTNGSTSIRSSKKKSLLKLRLQTMCLFYSKKTGQDTRQILNM